MTQSMLRKVADLICGRLDDADPSSAGESIRVASEIIHALRDPTPAMIAAGKSAGNDPCDIFRAMIDAA